MCSRGITGAASANIEGDGVDASRISCNLALDTLSCVQQCEGRVRVESAGDFHYTTKHETSPDEVERKYDGYSEHRRDGTGTDGVKKLISGPYASFA